MKRKDKDVEALWAEVKRLTSEMSLLQQQYDELTAGMVVHRGQELACSEAMCAAYFDERRRAEQLTGALEDIRSLSFINSAMRPNPLTLTAMLGDIHQIADAALEKGNE